MSPSRSRSTAVAAFVGSKGNADSKTKTKSNKASKAQGRKGGEESKACAPFKEVNEPEVAPSVVAVAVAPKQEVAVREQVQEKSEKEKEKLKIVEETLKHKESKENVTVEESVKEKEKEKECVDLGLSARDVRAYEHERQKLKREEEKAVRRAKKEREVQGRVGTGAGAGRGGLGGRGWKGVEVDGEYVLGGVLPMSTKKTQTKTQGEEHGTAAAAAAKEDILLSDLVVYSATRSRVGRRGGGLGEEEFEFVPAVRAVIVLDEGEFGLGYGEKGGRDMDVDDTWECVDGEKEEEALSYAQVVLGLHID